MRIITPIKQVPETSAVRMDEETGTMVRDGVEAIVNPLDLYAIESAISIRNAAGAGSVSAITMGPPKAEKALKEAISMGVDSGVLVSDRKFAGADTWSTSYVLAEAIKKMDDFDMIICGERATDGDTGQVGPGIAAFLDIPVISYVSKIESAGDGKCRVHRMVEEGYEIVETTLPAVLTVVKEVSDPRLPTLRGKQKARQTDIPVWSVSELDVEAEKLGLKGSPTRVVKIFHPKVTRQAEVLVANDEASLNAAADRVVELMREKEMI